MGSTFDLSAVRFGLSGGLHQPSPAHTRIHQAGEAGGCLCLLVEEGEAAPIPEDLSERLLGVMEAAYDASSDEAPEALAAALRAGNALLFERNLRADGAHQVLAGLQGVALQDGAFAVGQLGPAALCGVLGGRPLLTPRRAPWLAEDGDEPAEELPAGLRRSAAPAMYGGRLDAGDWLALVTTNLVQAIPIWDLLPLLAQAPEEACTRLAPWCGDGEWSAIRIGQPGDGPADSAGDADAVTTLPRIAVEAPAEAAAAPEPALAEEWAPEDIDLEPPEEVPADEPQDAPPQEGPSPEVVPDEAVAEASPPEEEEEGLPAEMPEPPEPEPPAIVGEASENAGGTPEDADEAPWGEEAWEGEDESAWADDAAAEPEASAYGAPARPRLPLPDLRGAGRAISERFHRLVIQLEDAVVSVLPDKVPERPSRPPRAESIPTGGKALVFLAMAIPLVMLGVVIATRMQYEASRRNQFGDIQARAQTLYEEATTSGNVAATRQGLYDALAASQEGLAISPGDEMLQSLKRRVEHQLDQINVVERIYTFYRLADLEPGPVAVSDASRIVVQGIDLYVLHRGADRVYRYLMNDVGDALQPVRDDPSLLKKGELYGGARVGDVVDIAWMQAGGQRTLDTFVMLDRTGTMFAYDAHTGIDALPVADADTWLKPEAIGGYFGNLYVLDPLLNTILKYVPTDNAYTNPPAPYLNPALGIDLTGAVDMAVDGNMYVLFANGDIGKFFDGERVEFTMNGLPSPMRSPGAIFVSGEQEPGAPGYVYVADTGNQRIVQFDKAGNYVRQLKAKLDGAEMEGLRGLWVDEESERLLLISNDALWYATLPGLAPR